MKSFFRQTFLLIAAVAVTACTQPQVTRGIGIYPGNPEEYDGPEMVAAGNQYRNLALHRAAWHSSSVDYNLTGHLVTDGIISDDTLDLMQVLSNGTNVEKRQRERIFDDNFTGISIPGKAGAKLEIGIGRWVDADIVSFEGNCRMAPGASLPGSFTPVLMAVLEDFSVIELPLKPCKPTIHEGGGSQNVSVLEGLSSGKAMQPRYGSSRELSFGYMAELPDGRCGSLTINLDTDAVQEWNITEVNFYRDGKEVSILPSESFSSVWIPDPITGGSVTVDLGAVAKFDRCRIFWAGGNSSSGCIETSADGHDWKKVADFDYGTEDISARGKGRYVRLTVDDNCAVSEFEVWGKGGVVPVAQKAKDACGDSLELSRGAWVLQRASEVEADGAVISSDGFPTAGWIPATVPGTVTGSYFNIGAIPDIRYDDDQLQISESFFNGDFWYRDTFVLPESFEGRNIILDFNGINWKADIYLNGQYVGNIDGAFMRGRFDVTGIVTHENCLAVLIHRNAHPGIIKEQTAITADTNGGILGADNPTFHPTIGWDWIPTVRGRDIGIWDNVYLKAEGPVSIDDGYILTHLAGGDVTVAPGAVLKNHTDKAVDGVLQVSIGGFPMEMPVSLAPRQELEVAMDARVMPDARLWWPAGYGEQDMYDVTAVFVADGQISGRLAFRTGLREMTYDTSQGILDIYVNGRRLIGNGGNWGFPEIYLNYRAREYDAAVAYHADMNFTMIRNWVGQTGDEEFFEACDRHGVMIWQDFWLANPWDGPDPDDNYMFLENARDFVRKIRRHPSIALYCGRNEGYPPEVLDEGLRLLVDEYHPGMFYMPHSAEGYVSGNGPYRALPVEAYFEAERGKDRIHSERGMPNVMTADSFRRMLRDENQWPQTSVWGMHDYTLENAQSAATFNEMVERHFGKASSLDEFSRWAQLVNYDGYRAMYESRSWNRKGLLIWMSHSCWPSLVWQTYDYYLCPTAAYFGAKKGSAPIRIQWNPVRGCVEAVNDNYGDVQDAVAEMSVVTYDGKTVFYRRDSISVADDSTLPLAPMDVDSTVMGNVHYLKLKLLSKDGRTIADNFYIHSEDGDLKILKTLPKASVAMETRMKSEGEEWIIVASLRNDGEAPALMLQLDLKAGGEQVLPVLYEDNWFSLLPGEEKQVTIRCKTADIRSRQLELSVSNLLD
ncbi:MAG: discoidin domain-containing protein [Bacteroidales bacterium]|nr:discoidin domain-containing protein [Bacteroidales bacterium]